MKLADQAIINIFAKSSEAILLIISSVVMVRYFSKSEYGTFLQIMLIVNTTIGLSYLGIPQSIYYFYPRALNPSRLVAQSIVISLFISLVVASGVYWLWNSLANILNNPELSQYGTIGSLLIFLRGPSSFREPILISNGSLIINSCATVICNLIIYAPLICAPFFLLSLSALLKMVLIATCFELSIYLATGLNLCIRERKRHPRETNVSSELADVSLKDQLLYALPIGISSYLGIIGKQMDQYIVSIFFSPNNFAVYSRGAMRIPVLHSIQITINNIMMPRYVKAYSSGDIKTFLDCFHRCIEKVAKVKYPVFAFLFAVAPSLVTLLYTSDYIEAASILRAYLLYLLTTVTVYAIIPRASGRTGCIMYGTAISISINIALSLVLIWMLGPIGAALGTVISGVITALYLLHRSCGILSVSFKDIFPWSYLGKLLMVTLAASFPVYCVEFWFEPQGIQLGGVLMGEGIMFGYVCMFLMMKCQLISSDDMELLSRWLRIDAALWLRRLTFC